MALDLQSIIPAMTAEASELARDERVVTTVAATAAVVIVALIALLIGLN